MCSLTFMMKWCFGWFLFEERLMSCLCYKVKGSSCNFFEFISVLCTDICKKAKRATSNVNLWWMEGNHNALSYFTLILYSSTKWIQTYSLGKSSRFFRFILQNLWNLFKAKNFTDPSSVFPEMVLFFTTNDSRDSYSKSFPQNVCRTLSLNFPSRDSSKKEVNGRKNQEKSNFTLSHSTAFTFAQREA